MAHSETVLSSTIVARNVHRSGDKVPNVVADLVIDESLVFLVSFRCADFLQSRGKVLREGSVKAQVDVEQLVSEARDVVLNISQDRHSVVAKLSKTRSCVECADRLIEEASDGVVVIGVLVVRALNKTEAVLQIIEGEDEHFCRMAISLMMWLVGLRKACQRVVNVTPVLIWHGVAIVVKRVPSVGILVVRPKVTGRWLEVYHRNYYYYLIK